MINAARPTFGSSEIRAGGGVQHAHCIDDRYRNEHLHAPPPARTRRRSVGRGGGRRPCGSSTASWSA